MWNLYGSYKSSSVFLGSLRFPIKESVHVNVCEKACIH